jgi:hypothetical protein
MAEEPPAGRRFRIIPLICGSLTIALGLLIFIGCSSRLPLLASVRAKYIPMAPSTPTKEGDRVINEVRQFSERESFDDDVCVVGMKVQHTGCCPLLPLQKTCGTEC